MIGSEVSKHLAKKSDFLERYPDEDPKNLQRVSLDYELQKGRTALIDEIRSVTQMGKKPSPLIQALAKLPIRMIITTNYDTHFEDAATECGKKPIVSFYRNNVRTAERTDDYPFRHDPSPDMPFVLKIHGDIVKNAPSIVITEEDYIQFVLRMGEKFPYHPVPKTALYFMSKWPTLFIGYSLRDYNLRLLFKTFRWQLDPGSAPEMYSVDFRPDPLILEILQNQRREVKYIVQDVWGFVPKLVKEVTGKDMTP